MLYAKKKTEKSASFTYKSKVKSARHKVSGAPSLVAIGTTPFETMVRKVSESLKVAFEPIRPHFCSVQLAREYGLRAKKLVVRCDEDDKVGVVNHAVAGKVCRATRGHFRIGAVKHIVRAGKD